MGRPKRVIYGFFHAAGIALMSLAVVWAVVSLSLYAIGIWLTEDLPEGLAQTWRGWRAQRGRR